jgi:hypothetical protein
VTWQDYATAVFEFVVLVAGIAGILSMLAW